MRGALVAPNASKYLQLDTYFLMFAFRCVPRSKQPREHGPAEAPTQGGLHQVRADGAPAKASAALQDTEHRALAQAHPGPGRDHTESNFKTERARKSNRRAGGRAAQEPS